MDGELRGLVSEPASPSARLSPAAVRTDRPIPSPQKSRAGRQRLLHAKELLKIAERMNRERLMRCEQDAAEHDRRMRQLDESSRETERSRTENEAEDKAVRDSIMLLLETLGSRFREMNAALGGAE